MKRVSIIPLIVVALMAASFLPGRGQAGMARPQVKISLDSAHLLMGNTSALHVEAIVSKASRGQLWAPGDTLTEGVEIASRSVADTTETPDGRLIVRQDLVIQSFDSGNYVIPPVLYIEGNETIASNTLALKVIPVNVDSLTTIHDYAPVAAIESHFWDWLPSWWGWALAGILIVAAGLAYYFLWYRKRAQGKPVVIRKSAIRAIPPHEIALRRLRKLHDEQLWENGQEKEYYTQLTEILREYIDTRFHINAMEMTSEQILRALRSHDDAKLPEVLMRQILQIADYVKFAKMRPFSEDNVKAYNDAVKFVEDTKPLPQPEGADENSEKNKEQKS